MKLKTRFGDLINKLPYISRLHQESVLYKKNSCFPPGHYYSPIISVDKILAQQEKIWKAENTDGIPGIDLQAEKQISLVESFRAYYPQIPFTCQKQDHLRYYFDNEYYNHSDGIILYSMIRHFKPARIIEIGSGFSSALMLDVNELFFDKSIGLTFVEPYPERLFSLMNREDRKLVTVLESDVQMIDTHHFEKLESGDILFIDSTHVVKTGSDVNYILFEILPRLKKGVLIHFHDMFYPFEYPREWVLEGRNWNENYFVRAFLMFNKEFSIKLCSHYLHKHHPHVFAEMPLAYRNSGGNLWIERN